MRVSVGIRGWILAGGQSLRFGRDKAMEDCDGQPLIERQAQTLRDARLDPWVVARTLRDIQVPQWLEPDGPRHPLFGVAAVLGRERENGVDRVFFMPVDTLGVTPETVRALVSIGLGVAEGQPLMGVFPVALAEACLNGAARGERVQRVLGCLPTWNVGALGNWNHPDQNGWVKSR